MQAAGPDGARVADAFQLASNPTITTGLPGAEPPSVERPAAGGEHALPDGVRQVLDGPALTQPFSDTIRDDNGNVIVHGEPTGPLQPTKGLDDLADIVQSCNRDLQLPLHLELQLIRALLPMVLLRLGLLQLLLHLDGTHIFVFL